MKYIEAPELWDGYGKALFLAGGITACEDWQHAARSLLADEDVTVLNPRRAEFDVTRGDSAEQQVAWEYHHLHAADLTMFWFPACDPSVTVQPIALFELGAAIVGKQLYGRRLVVGADLTYPRRRDIELQIGNAFPSGSLPLHEALTDTVENALGLLVEDVKADTAEGRERSEQ